MIVQTRERGSSRRSAAARWLSLVGACIAVIVVSACSKEPLRLTAPSTGMTPRFSGHGGCTTSVISAYSCAGGFLNGVVEVCVTPNSPPGPWPGGAYRFVTTQNADPLPEAGDVVTSPVDVLPGGCADVFLRLNADLASPLFNLNDPPGCVIRGTPPCALLAFPIVVPPNADLDNPDGIVTITAAIGGAYSITVQCVADEPDLITSCATNPVMLGADIFGGSTATFGFQKTPLGMIGDLRVIISTMDLRKGTAHSLDDNLREITRALDKGHTSHACKELDHFIKEVAEHPGKKIDPADAAILVAKANEIKLALGCYGL